MPRSRKEGSNDHTHSQPTSISDAMMIHQPDLRVESFCLFTHSRPNGQDFYDDDDDSGNNAVVHNADGEGRNVLVRVK